MQIRSSSYRTACLYLREPNSTAFDALHEQDIPSLLRKCSRDDTNGLAKGKQIHAYLTRSGLLHDRFLGNLVVEMYGKSGDLENAFGLFKCISKPNVYSCNIMMATYTSLGHDAEALHLFRKMPDVGLRPDIVTWNALISTYAQSGHVEEAFETFTRMSKEGIYPDVFSWNALISAHAQHGFAKRALGLFQSMLEKGVKPDIVSWNTVIAGYAQEGYGREALEQFHKMQKVGFKPDKYTLISLLSACANLASFEHTKMIHSYLGNELRSTNATWNALVDAYAKCGDMDCALDVFEHMNHKNVIAWTSIIAGYVQQGNGNKAVQRFHEMQREGVEPNKFTLVFILRACTALAALTRGKIIHCLAIANGFFSDEIMCTLVNMYTKCGSLGNALSVFDRMHLRSVISWTAMITGYAQHGYGKEAIQLIQPMQLDGTKADDITFIVILSACNYGGMLNDCHHYFISMGNENGMSPTTEHYGCSIDLFGRVGWLEEAHDFIDNMPLQPDVIVWTSIDNMPLQPDVIVWTSLVSASRFHDSLKFANYASEHIIELEPLDAVPYILLSNLYARYEEKSKQTGRWNEQIS